MTGAAIATGVHPGDRVAIWAPNMAEWIVAALGLVGAGAALVPLNTRFKGPEAAYVLTRSRARALFTVRGFLGIDYPAMLEDEDVPASGAHRPAPRRRGHHERGDDHRRGPHLRVARIPGRCRRRGGVRRGRRRRSGRRAGRAGPLGERDRRRPLRRHLHVGHDGSAQGRHDHPRPDTAHLRHLGLDRRTGRGRPLSRRQPVLPHLRLQGRHHRLSHAGRDDRPRARLRRGQGARHRGRRAHHGAPGTRPPSTSRSSTIPGAPTTTSRACAWPSPARRSSRSSSSTACAASSRSPPSSPPTG